MEAELSDGRYWCDVCRTWQYFDGECCVVCGTASMFQAR